jgi:hypothetical protein
LDEAANKKLTRVGAEEDAEITVKNRTGINLALIRAGKQPFFIRTLRIMMEIGLEYVVEDNAQGSMQVLIKNIGEMTFSGNDSQDK